MPKKNVSLKIGKHKSRTGGLTKAGREKYNRETGSNLKAPQPGGGPRKRSFCARMKGVKGPMKKPNGKPTRKALALANGNVNMSIQSYKKDGRKKPKNTMGSKMLGGSFPIPTKKKAKAAKKVVKKAMKKR